MAIAKAGLEAVLLGEMLSRLSSLTLKHSLSGISTVPARGTITEIRRRHAECIAKENQVVHAKG